MTGPWRARVPGQGRSVVRGLLVQPPGEVVGPVPSPVPQGGRVRLGEAVSDDSSSSYHSAPARRAWRSSRQNSSRAWRRPSRSRSAVVWRREAAWTSMRSRTAPRSASARTFVPMTSSRARTGPHSFLCGWAPERLLEDVDLALLTAGGIRDHEEAGERVHAHLSDLPAALGQPGDEGAGDLRHGCGVLRGHVEIPAEPVGQAVRLDGVPAGDDQGGRGCRWPGRRRGACGGDR